MSNKVDKVRGRDKEIQEVKVGERDKKIVCVCVRVLWNERNNVRDREERKGETNYI